VDIRQRILAAVCGVGLLVVIIELVRRRKLKEEYSVLWLVAGVAIVAVGLSYTLLEVITRFIGAGWTSSTLFFFGILFLVALCLQFSVKISALENRVKNLAQQLALLEARKGRNPPDEDGKQGSE
jgi:hypothetical protein